MAEGDDQVLLEVVVEAVEVLVEEEAITQIFLPQDAQTMAI